MSVGGDIRDELTRILHTKTLWTQSEVLEALEEARSFASAKRNSGRKPGKRYRCTCQKSDGQDWCRNCGGIV